jgi:uncharacterized protein
MAGSSLFALLDDIAAILDDIAILSKTALKKTSGVLGDDLALNAEQVSGVKPKRELPVVMAVAKGSFKNKLILVPSALAISAFIPWLIKPLLMLGGAYLCYEGAEKIIHHLFHKEEIKEEHKESLKAVANPEVDLVAFEQKKIKGAIRTDFILSAEIIVIVLGTVKNADFLTQVLVVSGLAIFITFFVYGLVAGIVKLDDAGLHLIKSEGDSLWQKFKRLVGRAILAFAPFMMKSLSVIGTIAMFLVGGGILVHGLHVFNPVILSLQAMADSISGIGWMLAYVTPSLFGGLFGLMAGALLVACISGFQKLFNQTKS